MTQMHAAHSDAASCSACCARDVVRRRARAAERKRSRPTQQGPGDAHLRPHRRRTADRRRSSTQMAATDAAQRGAASRPTIRPSTTTRSATWRRRGPTATRSVFVPLNDYTATVIGMVRDNVPFNTLAERRHHLHRRRRRPASRPTRPRTTTCTSALDTDNVDLSVHLQQNTQSARHRHPGGGDRRRA